MAPGSPTPGAGARFTFWTPADDTNKDAEDIDVLQDRVDMEDHKRAKSEEKSMYVVLFEGT